MIDRLLSTAGVVTALGLAALWYRLGRTPRDRGLFVSEAWRTARHWHD
jgi:hypothetical protein